ncbi:growth inhibitor [Xenococcus sp. PCC 7305]|uniref:type II toxin-antitoxin system PemK/MazF family toxin n=1 Tax=Xenococcus sp. PCC 7305 TaxID=102125 RepID=UPI0002AC1AA7|nr:type II toxin-antitoxin system PemK/MazF family toxin [Xenococcus sp. PCC 7305]ELS05632.1 growth inhibitor [Xenococcus sp. PCC 7305]
MSVRRGEIIRVNLNPTSGREQAGNARPCLVLSHTQYNMKRQGIVIVTPITNTVKPEVKIMVEIPSGFKVKGSVIAEQVKTIDLKKRWWRTTDEILPTDFVDLVVQVFAVIIG